METTNNCNNGTYADELEQMRHDMSELRSLLSEQQIVNNRLMRRAMNTNLGKEKRDITITAVAALALTPMYFHILPKWGLPTWFAVLTALFMLTACAASLWSLYRLRRGNLLDGNLLDVAATIADYKRFGNRWLCFSIPFLIVWLAIFFYFSTLGMQTEAAFGFVCGAATGAVAGAVIGWMHLRKSRKRINGILQQIDEIKDKEQTR